MISYLAWKIIELETLKCSILTWFWIWYEVNISESTSFKLIFWEDIELFVYHSINESSQNLYAFLSREEKLLFLELIKVSWVWWRSALNVLDLWVSNIFEAISSEDLNFFSKAKWIWKKMAEKIIVEIKDKNFVKLNFVNKWIDNRWAAKNIEDDLYKQIKNSLVSMGYNQYIIDDILKELPEDLIEIWEIIPYVIKKIN